MKTIMKKPKTPKPKKTRWEQSADRENDRRWKKAPLFVHAGIVPLATPEERQAKHERGAEAQKARLEEAERRREADAVKAASVRLEVAALVPADDLARMDRSVQTYPQDYALPFWIEKLAKARGEKPKTEPVIAAKRVFKKKLAAEAARQLPIFGPPPPTPEEILAVEPEPEPRRPCRECGWIFDDSGKGHPMTCAALRGFFLGLARGCAACRSRRDSPNGACDEHLADAKRCEAEGHVPCRATKGYRTGRTICSRCDISLDSEAA